MKKISMIHYAGPPVVGGVESTIYHHARLLAEAGFEVDVIAGRGTAFHPGVSFHLIPQIDSRHPDVLAAGRNLSEGKVDDNYSSLSTLIYKELGVLLKSSSVCIVHNAVTLHKNLALTAALRRLADDGLPLIAWSHDFAWQDALYTSDLHDGYPWDLLRTAWPNTHYVSVSKHRQKRLAELFGKPEEEIHVISPGIDALAFLGLDPQTCELANRLDLLKAAPLLLLPARITRRKNIEFAITITAFLKRSLPQVRLLVTGPPGPHNPKNIAYLESLHSLQKDLSVETEIHFLYEYGPNGHPLHLSDEVIAGLYRMADGLLFPSTREGFGIPVLEAGLARLPVFAADIPPVRESAGEFGYLFNPKGKAEPVAQTIAAYYQADRSYLLKRRVLDKFTWQAILEKKIIPLLNAVVLS
jgi:mannosylglucosylglycerate synthase